MRRMLCVARREYLERVRSRVFLLSTLLGPVLMAALLLGPTLLLSRQRGQPLRLAILDAQGALRPAVEESVGRRRVAGRPRFEVRPPPSGGAPEARAALRLAVLRGELDGYLYLPPNALVSSSAEYHGKNVTNVMDIGLLGAAVEEALVGQRLTGEGLDRERVRQLTRKLDLKAVRLSATGEREDRGGSFLLAVVLMTLLYTTLAMWGAAIMNGVLEEKTSRVVEVIVSSLPAWALFGGKLLGVGAAGLTQFLFWAASLALVSLYAAPVAAGIPLPEVPALLVVAFVVCFLLGYFLYGSLYAAAGAAVNTQQEAQSLALPVMLPLVLAFIFFPTVLGSPDSRLSVTLSLVPFFAPLLMFLRITAVTPPPWQLALGLALTLAAIAATTWAASRIYRVGILMYGKRPTLPEILRWVRRA